MQLCVCVLLHPHPFPPSQVLFGVEGTYRGKPAFHCCAYCPFRGECVYLCVFLLILVYAGMLFIKLHQVQLVEEQHRTPAGVQLLMQQYG